LQIYLVLIISFLLALIAKKKDKKIWVVLLITLLSCFVGFRTIDVGIDTDVYNDMFLRLQQGNFVGDFELGFKLLSFLIIKIFGSVTSVFLIYSLITNACIIGRLWSLRSKVSFSASVLMYLLLYYAESCNIMGQYLAVAIIFAATGLLDKKKYVKFGIMVALASLLHLSSVIAMALIPLHILFSSKTTRKTKRRLVAAIIVMFPVAIFVIIKVMGAYSGYFEGGNNSFGLMHLYRLAAWVVCVLFTSKGLFKKPSGEQLSPETLELADQSDNRPIAAYYLIGVALSFMGYIYTTLLRVGLCFNFFEMIFIPMVCKKGVKGYALARFIYVVYIAYFLYGVIASGWSGLADYSWVL